MSLFLAGCIGMEKFKIDFQIGSGAHATVYRAKVSKTDELVAIKELRPTKQTGIGNLTANFREITTLQRLRPQRHVNIIRLLEVIYDKETVFLVMEHCDDSLSDLLKYYRESIETDLPLSLIKDILSQIIHGMEFVHSEMIIHRDLKPQNILIKYVGIHCLVVKIADFGLAKSATFPPPPETLHVASLWYRSPEVLLQSGYDVGLDLWGIGCIFGELVTVKPLFVENCEIGMLMVIFQLLGTPTIRDWPGLLSYQNFSSSWPNWRRKDCLRALETIIGPSVGSLGFNLLIKFLDYDSNKRIRCSEAITDIFLSNSISH
jgi:serine/threonine protein kinase